MSNVKKYGQFFTPEPIARTLIKWAVKSPNDHLLDPSCGDGEFLVCHPYSVGIELDPAHASKAMQRAQASLVHQSDFFLWAEQTKERFDACVGNPPFIRYQGFSGEIRERALKASSNIGANFSRLTSSWAPFIAASASLLKPNGRIAFVVPSEIGHATYALPLLISLANNFEKVNIIAIKDKLFPKLSEDAWLLYAEGFGGRTNGIHLTNKDKFHSWPKPPRPTIYITLNELEKANGRLRRWLLPSAIRMAYEELEASPDIYRIGSLAEISIGYVTGGNDFFHIRPSQARVLGIPPEYLRVTVRKGEFLPPAPLLTKKHVREWIKNDEPVFLLHVRDEKLPESLRRYLSTEIAEKVRQTHKCSNRNPWYSVPGVIVPDGFLSYMSGVNASLVKNAAGCVATNSVHTVVLNRDASFSALQEGWSSLVAELSREIEGHPLGGGLLKHEPGEARRILLPKKSFRYGRFLSQNIEDGIAYMREWRHCG